MGCAESLLLTLADEVGGLSNEVGDRMVRRVSTDLIEETGEKRRVIAGMN